MLLGQPPAASHWEKSGFSLLSPLCALQAVTGCEDCLAALLDHDAFVLCRDFKGRTPIHLASACGHTAVLRTLLQAALSTDPLDAGVDYSGYSPMHWASYTGTSGASGRHRDVCCRKGAGSRLEGQRPDRTDRGLCHFSPSLYSSSCQDMKIVWSCYLNTAHSHTWRETPSPLCTVQCKCLLRMRPWAEGGGVPQVLCF